MIRKRSLILGVIFSILVVLVEIGSVLFSNGSPLCGFYSTPCAIIFFFLLVFIINRINSRLFKFLYLRKEELIVIYIMMIVSCAIVSWGLVLNLIGFIGGVYYYATDVNEWAKYIHPYLPKFLFISDREAIRYFYEGLPKGLGIPWRLWIIPLTNWFLFIIGFYLLSIFLMIMLREQWVERERLIYPLTELPTRMAEDKGFFKDKLMWLGFFIPFFFYSLIGLHKIFPQFPEIKLKTSISAFRGQFGFPLYFHFEMIGLAFLMSKDVLLSIWVFAIFYIILTGYLKMTGVSIGPSIIPSDPATIEISFLSFGALIIYTLSSLWVARGYLKEVFLTCIGKKESNKVEIFSYKTIFLSILIFYLYFLFWINLMGFKVIYAIYFTVITILIYIGLTKIIAQTGLAYFSTPIVPFAPTIYTFGSKLLGEKGIVGNALTYVWTCDIRTTVMASTANGLKLSTYFKINSKKIFFAIILSIIITYISACFLIICICYKYGAINVLDWPFSKIQDYVAKNIVPFIKFPIKFGKVQFIYSLIGGFFMCILIFLKNRFLWWPLSPIGFALGLPLPVICNWFSVFTAWVIKSLVLKYGGVNLYYRMKNFFLGMVLGAFFTGGIWNIIGYIVKIPIRFFVR
jgi:hypothetical protein